MELSYMRHLVTMFIHAHGDICYSLSKSHLSLAQHHLRCTNHGITTLYYVIIYLANISQDFLLIIIQNVICAEK